MKRLALAFLVACGSAPAPVAHPATTKPENAVTNTATTPTTPPTDDVRARAFIAKLAKHDYAGAFADFDAKMRAAMPEAKLADVWSAIETQAGAFERVDALDVTPSGDVRVAMAKASFARAPLVLRVVLDAAGHVAGFFVAPGDAARDWQPPDYAKVDAFEERPVTVGTSPALPGTLTLPKNAKGCPAVVLVHGSGPNDRDETVGPNKPFKDLAWGLASRGIVVLRYEKRTRVDPTGARTQKDEVEDAAHAAVALLRAQPEVDRARVALLGHSQGGYLAPRIAKADPNIRRLVIFAGSTRPLEDSILAQLRYLASLSPNEPKLQAAVAAAERFKAAVESPALRPTDDLATPFGVPIPGAYFLDVRGYRPERVAAGLGIPILVLQGERDYQVSVGADFGAWRSALAKKKTARLVTYPGLGHLFMPAKAPASPADYEAPAHVDATVIGDLATWLGAP